LHVGRGDPAKEAVRLMDQIDATARAGEGRPWSPELWLHAFVHPDATREAIGDRLAAFAEPCHPRGFLARARERLGIASPLHSKSRHTRGRDRCAHVWCRLLRACDPRGE